jgi:hypothetical protein
MCNPSSLAMHGSGTIIVDINATTLQPCEHYNLTNFLERGLYNLEENSFYKDHPLEQYKHDCGL